MLPSLQFVDVVVWRAVAMMSVWPVGFELSVRNCPDHVEEGGAVRAFFLLFFHWLAFNFRTAGV